MRYLGGMIQTDLLPTHTVCAWSNTIVAARRGHRFAEARCPGPEPCTRMRLPMTCNGSHHSL